MIEEDWRGFSSAFTESVRPEDPRSQGGRRVLIVGLASVLAAGLGCLVYGALGGPAFALPSEIRAIPPDNRPPAYRAGGQVAGQVWTAIAGPSCSASSDGSTSFAVYGYYTGVNSDQSTGWSNSTEGGYSGDACTGGYLSLPVSGQPSAYDDARFALWNFDFSAKFTGASCRVATYVPVNPSRASVGGNPAYFFYYATPFPLGSTQTPLGGYLVDQVAKQGQWVAGSAFAVTTGKVTVRLVDAGAKSGAAADAHVAAAQVRLTCTST